MARWKISTIREQLAHLKSKNNFNEIIVNEIVKDPVKYYPKINGKDVVLVISDLQCPFAKKDYIEFLESVFHQYKCSRVVCIGDELDFHTLSKYPNHPEAYGTIDEIALGVKQLRPLYKLFPDLDIVTSNHGDRISKAASDAGIPADFLKPYKEIIGAPDGWKWHDYIIIDGVLYEHGTQYGGQYGHIKACQDNRMSTVIGHIHSHAGVQYIKNRLSERIFGMNVGSLVDQLSYGMSYAIRGRNRSILSCGVVKEGQQAIVVPYW